MNLLLVFNPHAGGGRAGRLQNEVLETLAAFARVDCECTSGPGSATERVAGRRLAGYDGIVAAGGDGTLFEVVNGLCAHEAGERPPLGVLPIGTGNAFARDLGLAPGAWRRGADIIRSGRTRPLDVGEVDCGAERFRFLNIVGAGLPVAAMLTAERLKRLGRAAYSVATLWQALRCRSEPFELELDGERIGQDSLFVEIANTRYTGTSFLIAPDARLDDGLFDVVLVRRLPRRRLLRLFPSIYSGTHVRYPEVTVRRAREVRIIAPSGLPLAPDGELRGATPATVRCLPGYLDVFAAGTS
ncbi:MAG: diacylglycerol kinase family lipid kinase [Xanthomonadales bacterium]